MAVDQLLATWQTLREQFLAGANRHPKLHYRLIELSGQSRSAGTLPPLLNGRRPIPQVFWGAEYSIPSSDPIAANNPRSTAMLPWGHLWIAQFLASDPQVFEAYKSLAETARKVFAHQPVLVPVPNLDAARVTEHFPDVSDILPKWGEPYLDFTHVVSWIARSGDHLTLAAKTWTYDGNTTYSADFDEYRKLADMCVGTELFNASPLNDRDPCAERRYTDLPDLFMASAWAIDWIVAKFEEEQPSEICKKGRTSRQPSKEKTSSLMKPKVGDGLLLSERATGHIKKWLRTGQKPNLSKFAEDLGVHRSTLYDNPKSCLSGSWPRGNPKNYRGEPKAPNHLRWKLGTTAMTMSNEVSSDIKGHQFRHFIRQSKIFSLGASRRFEHPHPTDRRHSP